MSDYDTHHELPNGGTVAIDYGDMEGDQRRNVKAELEHFINFVREEYSNDEH